MARHIFALLLFFYGSYSVLVYAYSTIPTEKPTAEVLIGFSLWQKKNCQACHQLYGLGGYLGPDLTNIISDSTKGPLLAAAFIRAGTTRMPNFKFTETEIANLITFLAWVDKGGSSKVPAGSVTKLGNYNLDDK